MVRSGLVREISGELQISDSLSTGSRLISRRVQQCPVDTVLQQ